MPLKRILGAPTAWCIGMGVAIGSGIFRTPGDIATQLPSTTLIVAAWIVGGAIVLIQGLVTAEVATRFPQAGGEYVFLREAYGRFVAFFFGWAYTVFVIGAGSAVIAIAFGHFACEFFGLAPTFAGWLGASAIVAVTGVNVWGLRTGANTQNVLTILKIFALLIIVVAGFAWGSTPLTAPAEAPDVQRFTIGPFLAALLPVLWSYDGTTDSVKLAEEIRDVRRALPMAVVGSAVSLTVIYVLVNLALLRAVPAKEMAGLASVPAEAMERLFSHKGATAISVMAMLVCLGSISSTIPATVRVTFALARDGLTFRRLARMSEGQAPGPALLVVGGIATLFALLRDFTQVMGIYFLAATVLYGLSYASLIVFRRRETAVPAHVFRCPCGPALAIAAIIVQFSIAAYIAVESPRDAFYTVGLLLALAALYLVWPKQGTRTDLADNE